MLRIMLKIMLKKYLMVIGLVSISSSSMADTIVVGVEDLAFLPHYDGSGAEYKGFARDALDKFALDNGYVIEYKPYPIKRLYVNLVNESIDLKYPDSIFWNPEAKQGKKVVYSDSLVVSTDGIIVLRGNEGKHPSHLGTILGFTPFPFQNSIDAKKIKVTELKTFEQAYKMLQVNRIDAIYFNFEVANNKLKKAGELASVTFDDSLPKALNEFAVSSVKNPKLVEQFNLWLSQNTSWIIEHKIKFGLESE